jgi:hypothetical protein
MQRGMKMEEMNFEENNSSPDKDKIHGSPIFFILIFIALLEGAAIAYFYAQYRSQAHLSFSLQRNLESTSSALEKQISETARQRENLNKLNEQFLKLESVKNTLESNLEDKEKTIAELDQRLTLRLQSENDAKKDLKRQSQISIYLRKRLKESKEMELQLMERLEGVLKKKVELESRIANLQEVMGSQFPQEAGIPLKETTIAEPAEGVKGVEGHILIANNEYDFVIINLGSEDGIKKGDVFSIEEEGGGIGMAQVKKLYRKMCLADIMPKTKTREVKKNFIVKLISSPQKLD